MLTTTKQKVMILNIILIFSFIVFVFSINTISNKYLDFVFLSDIFFSYFNLFVLSFIIFVFIQNLNFFDFKNIEIVKNILKIVLINILCFIFLSIYWFVAKLQIIFLIVINIAILINNKLQITKILIIPLFFFIFLLSFWVLPDYDNDVKIEQILENQSNYFFVVNNMNQPIFNLNCTINWIKKNINQSDLKNYTLKIDWNISQCDVYDSNSDIFLVFWNGDILQIFAWNSFLILEKKILSDINLSSIDINFVVWTWFFDPFFDTELTMCKNCLSLRYKDSEKNQILDFFKTQIIENAKKNYWTIFVDSKFLEKYIIYYKLYIWDRIISKDYNVKLRNFEKYILCANKYQWIKINIDEIIKNQKYRNLCNITN